MRGIVGYRGYGVWGMDYRLWAIGVQDGWWDGEEALTWKVYCQTVSLTLGIVVVLSVVAGREVVELTDQAVFDEQCQSGGGAKRICFVAFLPNILDTGAAGRNEHIELIKTVAARQRKRPYR